ncbi:MAG: SMI1/KNR4 family protein [Bacteroidia bacterium]
MSTTENLLTTIEQNLCKLKGLDKKMHVFGASHHKYIFNNKIDNNEIFAFEKRHEIALPVEYKDFLLHFGNGGCGPEYGLFKLEQGIYDLPQNINKSDIIRLKEPFRFTTFWNMNYSDAADLKKWQDDYDHNYWNDGMLRICHLGCGTFATLVMNGKEKGNVWIDDRSNDGGIYPYGFYSGHNKTSFLEWYINWVDLSLKKFEK